MYAYIADAASFKLETTLRILNEKISEIMHAKAAKVKDYIGRPWSK
jgi:hypothetical protein